MAEFATSGAHCCDTPVNEVIDTIATWKGDEIPWQEQVAILNRIRQLRVGSDNMSQAQLARQARISRQTLHAIERGQRLPWLEVAYRVADALNYNLDYAISALRHCRLEQAQCCVGGTTS